MQLKLKSFNFPFPLCDGDLVLANFLRITLTLCSCNGELVLKGMSKEQVHNYAGVNRSEEYRYPFTSISRVYWSLEVLALVSCLTSWSTLCLSPSSRILKASFTFSHSCASADFSASAAFAWWSFSFRSCVTFLSNANSLSTD